MGGWNVQAQDVLPGRVPVQAAQVQVHAAALSPKRLSFRHSLPLNSRYVIFLSDTDEEKSWKPAITIKQILLGVQDLLNDPNPGGPAQADAFHLFKQDRAAYERRVRQIAREMQAQGQLA